MGDKRVDQAFFGFAVSGDGRVVGRGSGSKGQCETMRVSSSSLLSRPARSVSSSGVNVVSNGIALLYAAFG